MSSIGCQGLQTCLEPGLVEQRAVALRLVSPKPHLLQRTEPPKAAAAAAATAVSAAACKNTEQQCHNKDTSDMKDLGTFASVYSLTKTSKNMFDIHSFPRRSSSSSSSPTLLSHRSLELCTENLGCETGTDLITADFDSHSSSSSSNPNHIKHTPPLPPLQRAKSRHSSIHKKENYGSLPPPLTSISGNSSIHMTPHREGGRLVLKAITVPSTHACLQAERSNGRLRLRFVSRNSPCLRENKVDEEDEEGGNGSTTKEEAERKDGQGVEEEEEEEEGRGGGYLGRRRNGNEKDESGDTGIGKYQRGAGRCKEGEHGNKGLLSWKPVWVASS